MKYYHLLFVMLYRFSSRYNPIHRNHERLVDQAYVGMQMLTLYYIAPLLAIGRKIILKFVVVDSSVFKISAIFLAALCTIINYYLVKHKKHYNAILKEYENVDINFNKGVGYLILCSIVYALLFIFLDEMIN